MRANKDQTVREFWRVLAICHTVMVQEKNSEPALRVPRSWAPEMLSCPSKNQGTSHLVRGCSGPCETPCWEEKVT